ncbi:MAG: class A beta-lactamase-related serine hydrolase, partial [Eubacteriales bacterium]|nr:class A beta-lactamase-related serine hydrolase [Eubacteriales bacterium]
QSAEISDSYDLPDDITPYEEENALASPYTVAYPASSVGGVELPESIPQELLSVLENRLNNASFACSMYYCDLTTGFTISYNDTRLFGAASLIKAPYLLYIFDMIEKGELSLDDIHTYRKSYHLFGGTGEVQKMPDGTELTLKEIIEYIVYYSDNTAFKMLYNTSGSSGGVLSLMDFHYKAYSDYKAPFISGSNTVLNAGGVGRMFCEIYNRSKDSELFTWYVDLLKDANENVFIKKGLPKDESGESLYVVAHKYGMDIKASNDAAIVFYNDRPYVLIVLTDYLLAGSNASFIASISSDVFNIHQYICDETRWN